MQASVTPFKHHSTKIVGSISTWDDWKSYQGQDLITQCDWVELRLDAMYPEHSLSEILACAPKMPLLVTMRAAQEGGFSNISEEERLQLLEESLPHAKAIDIEIASLHKAGKLITKAKEAGVLVIASSHDFNLTPGPDYFLSLIKKAQVAGADMAKFAFTLIIPEDIQNGVEVLRKSDLPVALMGMGALGPISRLLYSQIGSTLIYGYLGSRPSAPGQWKVADFKTDLAKLPDIQLL